MNATMLSGLFCKCALACTFFITAPTAPLNLMAVGTAFNVSLQWNKPQPANGIIDNYIIQYYQPSTPTTITLFSSTTTETSVVVDGLSAFTDYTFRVSAVTVEEGDFSEVNVTTEESSTAVFTDYVVY